ncbi:GreA/GreB family elongation factor [Psychrosphaera aestuarii]|uniref:hypothetical protein n=1 Tax=Psychrosphaera aestuarii TaxID=1266052 RepID=UPI001B32A8D8|nr:hypothetical protein [Psychrosphaera aestuarii]
MTLNKTAIFTELFIQLEKSFLAATDAAEGARQLATHEQSKPETQYDTVGLEASYLAHGHSQRAADLANAIENWKVLQHKVFSNESTIDAGALVEILDSNEVSTMFLIGNYSGGLKIEVSNEIITVITLSSPLGGAMKTKQVGDEFRHPVNAKNILEITHLV